MRDKRPAHDSSKPVIRLVGLGDEFRDREWAFDGDFHVGRGSTELPTGLTLDSLPGNPVSRLHATMSHDEIGWWVTDRKSTNGTYLNGTRIGTEPVGPLRAGDTVQFATCAFRVDFASGSVRRTENWRPEGNWKTHSWARSTLWSTLTTAIAVPRREDILVRCGCARQFSHLFRPEHLATVEQSERSADGTDSAPNQEPVETDLLTSLVNALTDFSVAEADYLGRWLTFTVGGVEGRTVATAEQEDVRRDVFGGPEQIDWFNGSWGTSDVVGLAKGIYDSGDYSVMPILADALQDAGCEDATVLEHCRGNTPHVRGCWVVDEVLQHRSEEARLRQFGMIDPHTGVGNR
jgi:hypothetical protein